MALTNGLAQALRILEMGQVELGMHIQQAIEENPLLEPLGPPPLLLIGGADIDAYPAPSSLQQELFQELIDICSAYGHRDLAPHLFETMEEEGWFPCTPPPSCPIPLADWERIGHLLRQGDYGTAFARSRQEALLMQLERKGATRTPLYRLVRDQFPALLARRSPVVEQGPRLTLRAGVDESRQEEPLFQLPDLRIDRHDQVEVGEEALPPFAIVTFPADACRSTEERRSVARWKREADWLERAVNHRRKLLMNLGLEILRSNSDYLDGISPVTPLPMRQVAEKLHIHPSTLQRLLSEKVVAAPRGVWPLRHFFSQKTSNREMLKELIAQEKTPLSDAQLAQKLLAQGIRCSRRTVAKYRAELGIPSTLPRSRFHIDHIPPR
jgi:RNA polymerase sigma-54 factor